MANAWKRSNIEGMIYVLRWRMVFNILVMLYCRT